MLKSAATPEVIELLHHADAGVRNRAAMALLDRSPTPEIFAGLVQCLRNPATKGTRGTIVYVLYIVAYDCSSILLDLAECFLTGSYEEAMHASDILDDMIVKPDTAAAFRALLQGYGGDGWRREAIEEVLEFWQEQP